MAVDQSSPKPKRRMGRIIGLSILGLLVLIIALGAALYFRVPQKIGLVKSPAEQLLQGTLDKEKAAGVMQSLQSAGVNTKGVEVYVLPVAGTDREMAIVVLDASQGFNFTGSSGVDPVKEFIKAISEAQKLGIDRGAIQYRDETGKELLTVTVPTDAVVAYSQGRMTDQQLMSQVDAGAGDLPALLTQLQQLIN